VTADLNPRFDIDTFRVAPGNELLVSAARAVAERLGSAYNPLCVNGGAGLGKTHLLTAIGHLAQAGGASPSVEYLTPDRIAESFHAATSAGQSDAYRNRLADMDLLLLDDIHLVAQRPEIQSELLRLLPMLQASGKQIVIASLYSPADIQGLDPRLASLLSSGLVVDVNPPDRNTRLAILKDRAEERGMAFEAGVLEMVAAAQIANVRELVTLLNRLVALEAVGETRLTPEAARSLLLGEALLVADAEEPAPPPEAANEFEEFLSDVSEAVQHQIDGWRTQLSDAVERWREEGFETGRLEELFDENSPMPVEAAIEEFERDVKQLNRLRTSVAAADPAKASDALFLDPDRIAEAQALADAVVPEVEPPPGPSAAWTFDSYIQSEANTSVDEAAREISLHPATGRNPLVIIGSTGVGKTHLLHAIGNALLDSGVSPVACFSSRDFHDMIVKAGERGQLDPWSARLGKVPALLIDDLHLLKGSEGTQQELAKLVGQILDVPGQVVLTTNTPPQQTEGLGDELKACLENGTIVTLTAPDRTLRLALVSRMLEERVGSVDPELADYLADRPADSARAVMGLVKRVLEAADARGVSASAAVARELIEGAAPKSPRQAPRMRTSGVVISPAGGVKSREKMIWSWPDPAERLIEELT
jgi:chromosomal replication initiation ATPase DnaA